MRYVTVALAVCLVGGCTYQKQKVVERDGHRFFCTYADQRLGADRDVRCVQILEGQEPTP